MAAVLTDFPPQPATRECGSCSLPLGRRLLLERGRTLADRVAGASPAPDVPMAYAATRAVSRRAWASDRSSSMLRRSSSSSICGNAGIRCFFLPYCNTCHNLHDDRAKAAGSERSAVSAVAAKASEGAVDHVARSDIARQEDASLRWGHRSMRRSNSSSISGERSCRCR
jgi:hypothetical protein